MPADARAVTPRERRGIRFADDDRAGDDVAHELDQPEGDVHRCRAPVGQLVHPPPFGRESNGFKVRPRYERVDGSRIDQEQPLPAPIAIRHVANGGGDVRGSHSSGPRVADDLMTPRTVAVGRPSGDAAPVPLVTATLTLHSDRTRCVDGCETQNGGTIPA